MDESFTPLTWKIIKFFADDGRSVDQQLDDLDSRIRSDGLKYPVSNFRLNMITGLDLRPREWGAPVGESAENLIMLGCQPMLGIYEIMAFCRLIQRLGGEYTFLAKEYCCGVAMIRVPLYRGDKAGHDRGLKSSEEFIGMNIDEARRLGVKRMYYICPWCVYAAQRFYGDCDIEQRYYLDLIVDLLEEKQPHLKLDANVAYYQGGQHLRPVYLGDSDWDCNWAGYRSWMGRVEGLEITDMPKICCLVEPDRVRDMIKERNLATLVTPCWSCYGYLRTKTPAVKVKGFSELLLEALQS
ncbi:heterodisulfide reductase-related iron-sulfur binding cluster [Chloroflexota bacterium]